MLILLTRALDEAQRTAAKITAIGRHAVISPVLEMTPTGASWPLGAIDGVVATSTHGFELLSQSRDAPAPEARRLIPLYVVGERTLAAARGRGFEGRATVGQDARHLADSLCAAPAAAAPRRLVYLAGRDHKVDLETALEKAGIRVDVMEVYAAQAVDRLDEEAAALIESGEVCAAMHFSRRSAAIFLELAQEAGLDVAPLIHVAISNDAAAPLREAGLPKIHVAASPKEQSMLDLIETMTPRHSLDHASGDAW